MRISSLLTALALLATGSCKSAPTPPAPPAGPGFEAEPGPSSAAPPKPGASAVPVALAGEEDIWTYLAARYDANGDGTVTSAEYTRGSFGRLDRNGDGVLTEQDLGADQTPAATRMMGEFAAEAMLGWYFQDDERPEELGAGELERVLRGFDSNDDGLLDQPEFECAAQGQAAFGQAPGGEMGRVLRDEDPWGSLTAGIDGDADGLLADGEVFMFFEQRDEDRDGALAFEPPRGRAPGARPAQADSSGAAEGEWAPDFELPLDDGDGRVRLSSFRNERPVALIFGSYT